ncbi:ABC transporter permease [Natronoflexus pectinivorans]|uniref:FtsX-like permease family protein n=1 Tax=Natronoflexus pectinivorans TaxID=682526 RepID=A0A4R2GMK3_9BACT|nr:ABC transporter permease [Natronoflexus pectinivorans]TCO09649.1 FtsX-like permease family protein [Natronoflexus pectinivorans]
MQISNFIKTLFRNILLHRGLSLLTLLGLSLGIAMGLLVLIYVYFESNYDRFIPHSESIYRLNSYGKIGEDTIHSALTPIPLALESKRTEGVRSATRLMPGLSRVIESKHFRSLESNFFYADSNFFEVFDLPFLMGSKEDFRNDANAAIITVSASQRLFGYRNPIGERLKLDNEIDYTIKAVVEDIPVNSHLRFDILGNWAAVERTIRQDTLSQQRTMDRNWLYLNSYSYYLLEDGFTNEDVFARLAYQAMKKVNIQIEEAFGSDPPGSGSVQLNFGSISIHDINLYSDVNNELKDGSNPIYIKAFTGIAFFILIVTAINFMNLTTARSSRRFKEVAVRKVFFARRKDVIVQFLTEAIVYSFMALFLALVLVELFLPAFNTLFNINMSTRGFIQRPDLLWLIIITLITGMMAGSYPALFYSGLNPISIIKGSSKIKKAGILVRGFLVTAQVALSILLISLTLVMYGQLSFLKNADHGFSTKNTIVIERGVSTPQELRDFKKEIIRTGIVQQAGIAHFSPGEDGNIISFRSTDEEERVMLMATNYVDDGFFKAIGAKTALGRLFEVSDTSDVTKIIINESAARMIQFCPESNHQIELVGGRSDDETHVYNIIGVVHDIYFENMKNPSRPMVFIQNHRNQAPGHIIAQLSTVSPKEELIKKLNAIWETKFEGSTMQHHTLQKVIDNFYSEEKRFAGIAFMFSLLAYLLSVMSQIGFAAFLLYYHHKNIRLKTIFTAPYKRIMMETFSSFGIFVALSLLISIPLSVHTSNIWLSGFYKSFNPSWCYFLIPVVLIASTYILITYVAGKRELNKTFK